MSGLLGGCEQLVGIQDPGSSSDPIGPGADAPINPNNDGPGACATVPTFGAPTSFAAVDGAAVAVGDLNNDGIVDIAYADGANVFIFRGNGSGGFNAPQSMAGTAVVANGLLIFDLDGDGKQDLVTWDRAQPGDAGTNTVRAHRQSTVAGTFLAAQSFVVPGGIGQLIDVAIAPKLDDNNVPDLVVSTFDQGALPYFGSTTTPGTYTLGTALSATETILALPPSDIDGDGFDDVALRTMSSGIRVFFNKTAVPGTFDPPQTIGSGVINGAAFGRFAGNSPRKDLVMVSNPPFSALFVQNTPRAFTLQDSMAILGLVATGSQAPFQVLDLNGDTKDDVIAGGTLAVQCSSGTFFPSESEHGFAEFGEGGSIEAEAFGDLNADGKPDAIQLSGVAGGSTQFMKVYLQ